MNPNLDDPSMQSPSCGLLPWCSSASSSGLAWSSDFGLRRPNLAYPAVVCPDVIFSR